jgi:energy-coupling factor transporter ATP-binding protein EcfA2
VTKANLTSTQLLNPFPGLRPFHENEEHLFFGRESQIDTMVDELAATRFLAVVGTSGSGKSSLVNCGLKPALSRGLMSSAGTSWRMAQFRPGGDPIKAMAHALAQPGGLFSQAFEGLSVEEIIEATLRMSKLGLVDIYEQAHLEERPNLLVIVDQFEELFRYRNIQPSSEESSGAEDRSVAFVNLLLEAASSNRPIYLVLTMRSDFLGGCSQFPGLPEAINRGQYLVPRMSRDERRSAIAGPVAVAGGEISPVLLTRLVNDVGDNPDQLSILQHALNRTWAQWQRVGGIGAMDLPHYEAIGTMSRALDLHAGSAYAELRDDRQRIICQKVFQALTDKGPYLRGVRRPTSAETLCLINDATLDELKLVLDVFRKPSRSFVMPPMPEPIAPETVIDISHESLMRIWNRLKGWVDEEAESASQYERLVQNMSLHAKGGAGLMTDPELSLMK